MNIDLGLVARDGALLALAAATVIMSALRLNPRLFLRHFPAAVKASQPPLSAREKTVGRVVAGVLIVLLVGVPIWSARAAAIEGAYGRFEIFAHAFLAGMIFNVVDWPAIAKSRLTSASSGASAT
jgi:hypothetical protein